MTLNSDEIHVQNKERSEELPVRLGCSSQVEPRQSMCEGLGLMPTLQETKLKPIQNNLALVCFEG